MNKMLSWMQQPTSVAGISAIAGTVSALALHQINWPQAIPLIAGALVSIVLPDNAGAKASAESLALSLATQFERIEGKK